MFGLHIKHTKKEQVSHIELIKYYHEKYNCNVFQFFLPSPKRAISTVSQEKKNKLDELKNYAAANKITLIVHLPFTINIATSFSNYPWWINSIIKEYDTCTYTNVKYLVMHTGNYATESGFKEGLSNMKKCIKIICRYVYKKYDKIKTKILLENCAGQGNEMLYPINDFLDFYAKLNKREKKVFKVCLDTCHLCASGYQLTTKKDVDKLFDLIDTKINLKSLKLIHLNDSKNACGSRVDRHEALGDGEINISCINRFIEKAKKFNIPMVLETPAANPSKEFDLIKKIIN